MPDISVEPEIVLEHEGVTIYHVYRHDNMNDVPRQYWYGYAPDCDDNGYHSFDIRDLPNFDYDKDHALILREAIEQGFLMSSGPVPPKRQKEGFNPATAKDYWLNDPENGEEPLPTHVVEIREGNVTITHVDGPGRVVAINHDEGFVRVFEQD